MQDSIQDAQDFLNDLLKRTRENAIRRRIATLRTEQSDKYMTIRFLELLLPENADIHQKKQTIQQEAIQVQNQMDESKRKEILKELLKPEEQMKKSPLGNLLQNVLKKPVDQSKVQVIQQSLLSQKIPSLAKPQVTKLDLNKPQAKQGIPSERQEVKMENPIETETSTRSLQAIIEEDTKEDGKSSDTSVPAVHELKREQLSPENKEKQNPEAIREEYMTDYFNKQKEEQLSQGLVKTSSKQSSAFSEEKKQKEDRQSQRAQTLVPSSKPNLKSLGGFAKKKK